jgi:hypothetical protein
VPGRFFGGDDRAQQLTRDPVATADDAHPDVVRHAAIDFGNEVTPEQPHEQRDFARRARPVVAGERV